jgi:hypothetical protein
MLDVDQVSFRVRFPGEGLRALRPRRVLLPDGEVDGCLAVLEGASPDVGHGWKPATRRVRRRSCEAAQPGLVWSSRLIGLRQEGLKGGAHHDDSTPEALRGDLAPTDAVIDGRSRDPKALRHLIDREG